MVSPLSLPIKQGSNDFTILQIINRLRALGSALVWTKSITVEAPTAAEDISFFYTETAITITNIEVVMVGTTPSVTWTLRHGTDRSAAGTEVVTGGTTTTDTTTGESIIVFDDPTIAANSFIWVETTAQSGTVTSMAIAVSYTGD